MAKGISLRKMVSQTRRRFAVPMFMSLLTTAAAVYGFLVNYLAATPSLIFMSLFCGLCFSTAGTLLAEALDKQRVRTPFSIVGAILGIALMLLFSGLKNSSVLCSILALSAALFCCAFVSKGSRPAERLGQAIGCIFVCLAVSILVMIVLFLLVSAVSALFSVPYQTSSMLQSIVEAVSFMLIAPFLLFSFLPDRDSPPDKYPGLRKLLAYVVLPAYLILLAVLLGYIVTILIRWEMPIGQMNPYALLALGTFTALRLLLTGEENALSRFFIRWGAWPLLPVIAAQAVGVYIRVSAYGLTESRIYGLALTLVCLIVVVAALCRRRGGLFFLISAILTLILVLPPVSARTLARLNQENRLYTALSNANMLTGNGQITANEQAPENEKRVIWSAAKMLYDYKGDVPETSRTVALIRQLDATDPEQKSYFTSKLRDLVGFSDPSSKGSWQYFTAKGTHDRYKLDVSGFSHAEYCYVNFTEENEWCVKVGDKQLQLDTLLALADFDTETLSQDEITLNSGRVLRIISFEKQIRPDGPDRYTLSAWLMTPEKKPEAAERYLDWYSPGAVLYLPDFTGTGSEWVVNTVTAGDEYVRVTSVPVDLNQHAEGANPKPIYEIRMEGVTPEEAYIWLDLRKGDEVSWRYNIYVIVDESLDVKIQYAELLRWPTDISNVHIDYGTSERFSREDMDQAIAIILRDFSENWLGFTVHAIKYTSDETSQREFDKNKNTHGADSQGQPYVDGIVFESSFHTPMTDDGLTGFETGEWDDYHWTLLRTKDGEWEIVNQGYC